MTAAAPPRRSRAEWFTLMSRLHTAGLTSGEIAEALNIGRSYVRDVLNDPTGAKVRARKDRYRKPCPRCGRKMDGSNGRGANAPKLCAACSLEEQIASRRWTPEMVVAAIQRWARLHGRPPTSPEWLRAGVWVDEEGEFRTPAASTVYSHPSSPFPCWSDAIVAAGFERPWRGPRSHTGATDRIRTLVADGGEHTWGELRRASGGTASGAVEYLHRCGELERLRPGLYIAGPNLRVSRAIPASSSDSSTAARAVA